MALLVNQWKLKTLPDPTLRLRCFPVDPKMDQFDDIVERMKVVMREKRGVGLAGPQIGFLGRIFVWDRPTEGAFQKSRGTAINPVIRDADDWEQVEVEGCLSIPGKRFVVPRPRRILLEYENKKGKKKELDTGMDAFLARIFAHEMDHLQGKLCCDRGEEIDRWGLPRFVNGKITYE